MSTIKEVAALAGVSICTASRALNNKDNIRPETRKRILDAVRELDYRPNFSAQSLKHGRTKTLGLIVPDITNPYYPKITKSIEEYAANHGYMLLLCDSNGQIDKEKRIVESLKDRHVDGIIALPCSNDVGHIQSLRNAGVPYVFINRQFRKDLCSISTDNFYGGYTMVRYLIENGHHRICGIFPEFDNQIYEERFHGAQEALREHGILEENVRFFLFDVHSMRGSYDKITALLTDGRDRPTAVFCANDMLVMGVYGAIRDCNLKIRDDISIVGYDDIPMASMMTPPLTTFLQPEDEIAEKAINYLLELIDGNAPHIMECLRGKIIIRESVKKI